LCKGAETENCLTAPQIEGAEGDLQRSCQPAVGEVIFPGPALGGELPVFEFANPDVPMRPANLLYAALVFGDPNWDFKTLDYDKGVQLAKDKVASAIETARPTSRHSSTVGEAVVLGRMERLQQSLLLDGLPAELQKLFGAEKVAKSFQMYFLPGVNHCGGGEGCDNFSKLGAITEW